MSRKKLIFAAIISVAVVGGFAVSHWLRVQAPVSVGDLDGPMFGDQLSENGASYGSGVVTRLLPDDLLGGRFQKFVLRLADGRQVQVAHNLEEAERLTAIKVGDTVSFRGIYAWNANGGVIYRTHDDQTRVHPNGWLRHNGAMYR